MKRLFILVAVLFMISVRTPATVQETWNSDLMETASIENWTAAIQEWFADKDITINEYKEDLTQFSIRRTEGGSGYGYRGAIRL